MILKAERLPGEEEEALGAGEKRVKLVFAASHSIPKTGDFSLFDDFSEEYGEEDEPAECDGAFLRARSKASCEYAEDENDESPFSEETTRGLYRLIERLAEEKLSQQEEEEDKYVLRCDGIMSRRGDDIVVRYRENEDDGMEDTLSEILIPRGRTDMVSIIRTGGVVNTLICEKGKRHVSAYKTSVMPFELCVFTKECEHNVRFDEGGSILLNYYVELRGTEMQHTRMRIAIKPE